MRGPEGRDRQLIVDPTLLSGKTIAHCLVCDDEEIQLVFTDDTYCRLIVTVDERLVLADMPRCFR